MSFQVDQTYSGFRLKRKTSIQELRSLGLLFEHEQTGAEVLVLENDDDNKVFSVTFRTPPENDRGVAHIMEHSVLCGSRKYPVKEPFLELMKGSLQTFLNAMTFPDKTMFPVASRNQKDFFNLMNVYLDAVFYPRITEETFMQEGWHHDLESKDKDIQYKGVVYNEMKGVFSSPENLVDRYLSHLMFPGTAYGYESGGDPKAIPDLTYEEFREFHRKYYHPSNSRFFFYGNGDTREYLEFLDKEYLKDFQRQDVETRLSVQRRFRKPKRKVLSYPVSKEESLDKKTFVLTGMKLDKATNHEHCLAFDILSHLLLGTSASPLRKALMDSELGSEVIGGGFDDHRLETVFAVGLKGTEAEHEAKILDLIFNTLQDLVEGGIDENLVTSAVNTIDFKLREANFGGFAKGIVYNIQALGSWLYGKDPFMHLRYDRVMKKIKERAKDRYFESLIERYLLNNPHRCVLVAVPKPGLGKRQETRLRKKLKDLKSTLSPEDLEQLVSRTRKLQEIQRTPDRPEDLDTLPRLDLKDISRESEKFPLDVKNETGPTQLFHDLFCNNIAYLQIGFNTDKVPLEKIQYLPLLGRLLVGMGTRTHDYVEISKLLGIHTGGIRPYHFTGASIQNRDHILSYILFNGKALMEKLDELFALYTELFTEYRFDHPKRLVEIIRSAKSDLEDSIVPHGNQFVLSRLQSYQSRLGRFDEWTDGITYFKFLENLLERAEKNPQEVAAEFQEVAQMVISRENALFNVTGEGKHFARFDEKIQELIRTLPDSRRSVAVWDFGPVPTNEAFLTASTVQYVGKGTNLYDLGFRYTGQFNVVKSLISTGFLWERVRMQGGAYGSFNSFDFYSGDYGLVSYRDPNLVETLKVYDEIPEFLSRLDLTDEELKKIIIGCVGQLDPPLTPDRKGSVSMIEYLTGWDHEKKQKHREELLSTRPQDLKTYVPLFEKVKTSGKVCVLGNEEKIRKARSLFKQLVPVFN